MRPQSRRVTVTMSPLFSWITISFCHPFPSRIATSSSGNTWSGRWRRSRLRRVILRVRSRSSSKSSREFSKWIHKQVGESTLIIHLYINKVLFKDPQLRCLVFKHLIFIFYKVNCAILSSCMT